MQKSVQPFAAAGGFVDQRDVVGDGRISGSFACASAN
jgi:hypothetical protein